MPDVLTLVPAGDLHPSTSFYPSATTYPASTLLVALPLTPSTPVLPPVDPGANVPIHTGSTLAALGSGTVDGQLGIIRVGTWPNDHEELLKWNASAAKWVGDPFTVVTQSDTWSLDTLDKPDLTAWGWIVNPNPQAGVNNHLVGAQNLIVIAGATVTVADTTGFSAAGTLFCRGNRITYTGKTGTTFTGCANTLAGMTGSVPTNSSVTQYAAGGFGFVCSAVDFVKEMMAAGLTLQEKFCGFLCGSLDTKALTVAPYWHQYDSGDGNIAPVFNATPTGGLGFSASLTGTTASGGVLGSERTFVWAENSWTTWSGSTPTKRYMIPTMYGKMPAAATDAGQIVDGTIRLRWVG